MELNSFVVQTRGMYAGRIGMVDGTEPGPFGKTGYVWVRFGADGPTKRLKMTSVRSASQDEIDHVHGCC